MKLVYNGVSIWNYKLSTKSLILCYPIFVVLGKVIRWTIMYSTLIGLSAGWGAVDPILYNDFNFQFFGMEEIMATNSDSWGNAIAVFKILRGMFFFVLDSFQTFEVAITIVWGVFLLIVLSKLKESIDVIQWLFIMLSCIVLNIFDFALAKEPIQMLYFLLIFAILVSKLLSSWQKEVLSYGVIVFSILTFRVYYLLILFFALIFKYVMKVVLLLKKRNKEKRSNQLALSKIIIVFLAMFLSYFCFMTVLMVINGGFYKRFSDCLLTASAATSASNSYIKNMIADETTTNVFFIALEYALVVFRMTFPLELLRLGIKYYPYVAYQVFTSILMLKTLASYRKNTKEQNIALIIYMGFLFASCTFEVDFGAWVRHGAVTFPVLVVMIGAITIRKRREVSYYVERQYT